jgi:hypothetical protein
MGPLGVDDGEHLPADAEHEIAAPLDVFGGGGQAEAEAPDGVYRHLACKGRPEGPHYI